MSLGTGIFLSALFLGVVVLFIATKDRWNWKRGFKWLASACVAIFLVAIVLFNFEDLQGAFIRSLPAKPHESLWGLKLGMPESDVRFLKGDPVEDKNTKSKTDEGVLFYRGDNWGAQRWWIMLDEKHKVHSVIFMGSMSAHDGIQGIKIGASVEDVTKKFGQPADVQTSENALSRTYRYPQYNLLFRFTRGKVDSYALRSSQPINLLANEGISKSIAPEFDPSKPYEVVK